jgi:8-oxo-dGTP diphosphatase
MINGKNRDFCPLGHQNILIMSTILPVACAVIIQNGQILCTQRSSVMVHPLHWEFPGGKVEQGETAADCIVREIREELGIDVIVERALPSFPHSYGVRSIELIPFICRLDIGEVKLKEHQQFLWLPLHELEKLNWVEADVAVVRYLIENSVKIDFLKK